MFKKKLVKHRFCNKCNTGLFKSNVKGYSFYCANCDEDLYEFETHKDKNSTACTTTELCSHCSTEVELPVRLGVYTCPNCGKLIINCSMCYKKNCIRCNLKAIEEV